MAFNMSHEEIKKFHYHLGFILDRAEKYEGEMRKMLIIFSTVCNPTFFEISDETREYIRENLKSLELIHLL